MDDGARVRQDGADGFRVVRDRCSFFLSPLRKKHVLGWARREGERWTLLATAVGRAEDGGWAAD